MALGDRKSIETPLVLAEKWSPATEIDPENHAGESCDFTTYRGCRHTAWLHLPTLPLVPILASWDSV